MEEWGVSQNVNFRFFTGPVVCLYHCYSLCTRTVQFVLEGEQERGVSLKP